MSQQLKATCPQHVLLRSSLPENLVLGKRKAPDFMQVRWVDQTQYPEDTIESFVGQSSMGLLRPPAHAHEKTEKRFLPWITGLYTHTCSPFWGIACFDNA